ncbi:MAG: hypothetical protein SGPRY_005663, partial [Prymnesium sp.]
HADVQVSLDEEVWQCEETKKVCFNQTQIDLHKRRVPEALTWVKKSVADLRTAWKEREMGGEVESEEDMLLRVTGKKGKGKDKSEGPPVVIKARSSGDWLRLVPALPPPSSSKRRVPSL